MAGASHGALCDRRRAESVRALAADFSALEGDCCAATTGASTWLAR